MQFALFAACSVQVSFLANTLTQEIEIIEMSYRRLGTLKFITFARVCVINSCTYTSISRVYKDSERASEASFNNTRKLIYVSSDVN
jgi:hypothetical protein